LYRKRCPFCGHNHLIRWGYYTRRGLPMFDHIRIQRIRCKSCHRTTNVLPSFLLANKQHTVNVVEDLVTCYINQPDDWQGALDISIDISTAYRYLRALVQQVNDVLPELRKALLSIDPHYCLTEHIDGAPPSVTSKRSILQRFVALAQRLLTAGVRLARDHCSNPTELYPFINYFLATDTKKALLQC
jgi:transposase-like protein